MGVWTSALELFRAAQSFTDAGLVGRDAVGGVRAQPISWAQRGELAQVVWSDVFGARNTPVLQAEAMRVPAIVKGRALLQSLISPRPLVAIRNVAGVDTVLTGDQAPTWLYRSDTGISPQLRTSLMLDDLIFHEATLLVVQRGSEQQIVDAVHCPRERWDVNPETGAIEVDDVEAPAGSVVWIPGPSSGLLREAADTIRAARDMTRAWAQRVATPMPSILLKEQDTNSMTDAEVDAAIAQVAAARRSPDGAVAWIPAGVDVELASPGDDSALFENGRNALRLDIANYMNIPAALLDGSPNTASLTYQTREGQRNDLQDYTLAYWTSPIESALSQDNVVPRGTRIRFNFGDLDAPANAPTGAATED